LPDRGWVGWKRGPDRETVELLFEFDTVREFHAVHVYTNNQFTRDVAVFKEARVAFSIGGKIFTEDDPVTHFPMEDTIFEEPRNVTFKLHRRAAKYIKLTMSFASKWIMISEVSFDSSVARGNYTAEVPEPKQDEEEQFFDNTEVVMQKDQIQNRVSATNDKESEKEAASAAAPEDSTSNFMPVVIGVLTAVILLLAGIIFFIVNKTRQRKFVQLTHPNIHDTLGGVHASAAEKMALNPGAVTDPFHQYSNYEKGFGLMHTATSDTGSSGSKVSSSRQPPQQQAGFPKLDDNYNTPHQMHLMGTPRSMRTSPPQPTAALYSVSRNGSVRSHSTPLAGGRKFPPVPRLQVPPPPPLPPPNGPEEAVYTEPGNNYTEPYRAMRYSPYYGYGPALSEIENTLMNQPAPPSGKCGLSFS
jgi:hypothetical protein